MSDDFRTAWTVILFGGLVALAVVATIPRGGPVDVARTWHSFNGAPIGTEEAAACNEPAVRRLVERPQGAVDGRRSTSGATIRSSARGAGTFTAAFYARGDRTFDTENGHSLYFETLGELGVDRLAAGAAGGRDAVRGRVCGRGGNHCAATALGGFTVIVVQAASIPTGSRRP